MEDELHETIFDNSVSLQTSQTEPYVNGLIVGLKEKMMTLRTRYPDMYADALALIKGNTISEKREHLQHDHENAYQTLVGARKTQNISGIEYTDAIQAVRNYIRLLWCNVAFASNENAAGHRQRFYNVPKTTPEGGEGINVISAPTPQELRSRLNQVKDESDRLDSQSDGAGESVMNGLHRS